MNRPQYAYTFPDDTDPEVQKLKRLAARVGRAYQQSAKFEQTKAKLFEYMQTLKTERLRYWAKVVMLDPRFSGATGAGAYWAVASEQVKELARDILRERDCELRLALVARFQGTETPLKAEELKSVQEQVEERALHPG